ncbi:MAG: hypothetical protein HY270_09835 [Deltaproteobacteria bacterium]|nr:hypothetical protein [Deltaproteobacteria bacterium]
MTRTSFGVLALCVLAGTAAAQVTTQGGGAVLVFPRVIADGTWDTAIEIGNGANHLVHARCYYVDAQLANPQQPPGPANPPLWTQTDFEIWLTRLQPTHWTVSRGRLNDPSDQPCRVQDPPHDCDGAGFDPGLVPLTPSGFAGELRCIELDASGAPWSGNALEGVATLTHLGSGEVVKYSAFGIPGLETNDADGNLCLGGAQRSGCPLGAEYSACPLNWTVSHPSDFDDSAFDGPIRSTNLAVVPCASDFENQVPTSVTLQFKVTNELEQTFSASTTVTCWADLELGKVNAVFQRDTLGGEWAQTQIRSAASTPHGFLVVQQTKQETGLPHTLAASGLASPYNGAQPGGEFITLPQETVR